jgi:hypothetical protein
VINRIDICIHRWANVQQIDHRTKKPFLFLIFYLPTEMLSPWPKAKFPSGVATAPPTPKPMPKPPKITYWLELVSFLLDITNSCYTWSGVSDASASPDGLITYDSTVTNSSSVSSSETYLTFNFLNHLEAVNSKSRLLIFF